MEEQTEAHIARNEDSSDAQNAQEDADDSLHIGLNADSDGSTPGGVGGGCTPNEQSKLFFERRRTYRR